MHPPLATLDDDAWEDLLNFIEERRVIPIIGPELLKVETEDGPRLLYDWVAEKLAAKLGVDTRSCRSPTRSTTSSAGSSPRAAGARRPTRGCAASCAKRTSRRRSRCDSSRRSPTSTSSSPRPSTRCSSRRSTSERFGGAQSTEVIAYAPNRVADLPTERERLQRPVIYHLLGRLSASPTYVISDEDTLEFICALQSEHLTPEKLFHELEHNHLLFIGSSFTNWLARLFLRMAKRHRLSDPRDVGEVLADNHSVSDGRLMGFLQQVSVRTRVYSGAEKFVDELHRRWMTRRKPGEVIELHAAAALPAARARDARQRGVHQLRARRPCRRCRSSRRGSTPPASRPGSTSTASKAATTTTARSSATSRAARTSFPVVSATTERRLEGYFRREWSYAIDRARNIAEGALFILPGRASTTRTATTRRCPTSSRRCTSRACRAAR